MPVITQVAINSDVIYNIHIMHMEGMNTEPTAVNRYSVIVTDRNVDVLGDKLLPSWGDHMNDGVYFDHMYGDGALVCLAKGLQAWQDAGSKLWD